MPLIKIPRLFLLNENSCQGLSLISDIFCGMTGDSVHGGGRPRGGQGGAVVGHRNRPELDRGSIWSSPRNGIGPISNKNMGFWKVS